MMICYYFSSLIDQIWLDEQDNILFILFSVLAELNLICGIWALQPIQDRSLGPIGPGPHFALEARGLGASSGALLLWAWRVGRGGRFSNPISCPQPLCTECVGKGCNSSHIGGGFHVSAGGWVN